MSLPGPSSLGRIAACIASEALPHANSSNPHSKRGDVIHAFLKNCNEVGREAALLKADPEEIEILESIPVDRLPSLDPKHHVAELALAFDLATGKAREIGRGLSRDEARAKASATEMVGTVDLGGVSPETFVLYDWKTGHGHVDRAEVNWQAKTYALLGARAYGLEAASGAIIRIKEDSEPWFDTFEMDSLDLDAHETELRALMKRRAEVLAMPEAKRPPLHEGSWCKYCPALAFCPAKMNLLRATFDSAEILTAGVVELTPERAASAWTKIGAAKALLKRLEDIVKDYARQSPFSVGDGYVVSEIEEHKETLIPEHAKEPLEQLFGALGETVFSESVEVKKSLTKVALGRALRKYVLPTLPKAKAKITHLERDVLEALRESGAVSVASFQHVKEHKAKEPGE